MMLTNNTRRSALTFCFNMHQKYIACSDSVAVDTTTSEYTSGYSSLEYTSEYAKAYRKEDAFVEIIIGSGIAACLIYAASKLEWHDKNTKIMLKVFENIDYKVRDQIPKLIKKVKNEKYIDYVFSVPYGLVDDEKLQPVLQKTLMKNVKVMFKGKLIVRVYENNLPSLIKYDWSKTNNWSVPIGYSLDGIVYHNFDQIPHMSISGTTRYGKTILLKLIFAHLVNNNPDVEFYIIDLKRLEFNQYKNFKQVKQIARTNEEVKYCLESIISDMDKTIDYFEKERINNIVDTDIKWRKFIIVDEGGQLDEKVHKYLEKIAQIGGAIGYRLIFATQYSTGDIFPRQVKQNSDARIAFRLPTVVASRVAIDEVGAEKLEVPGRAIYRTAEKHIVQVPFIKDEEILEKLRRFEVDSTREKATTRREDTFTIT